MLYIPRIKHTLLCLSACLLLTGCPNTPIIPETPEISFEALEFEVTETNIGAQVIESYTLRLSFEVIDGDGDIGLDGSETLRPYHEFDFVLDDNGDMIELGQRPGDPTFNCINWVQEAPDNTPANAAIDYNGDGDTDDILLVEYNENRFNIFVDFLVKQPDGSFVESDVRTWPPGSANEQTFCNTETFDGRIPCLSTADEPCDFVRENMRPIQGIVTYEMNSSGFLPVFRNETLMLAFQIQDRALHRSEVVYTPEFTLQEIRID